MYFDIPIVAYNSTAIPDTLGGSGVLLETKEPDKAALEVHHLITQKVYREEVIAGQQKRLKDFSHENVCAILAEQLSKFINGDKQ